MKLFLLKHKIFFSILSIPALLIGLILFYEFAGQPIGYLSAHFDQIRGNNRIKLIGMANITDEQYARLLDDKHGIKADRLAYCTPTIWESAYHNAYNAIAIPAIKKKLGESVFDECYGLAVLAKLKETDLSEEVKKMLESNLLSFKERSKKQ